VQLLPDPFDQASAAPRSAEPAPRPLVLVAGAIQRGGLALRIVRITLLGLLPPTWTAQGSRPAGVSSALPETRNTLAQPGVAGRV
jgi:hypothetical protein